MRYQLVGLPLKLVEKLPLLTTLYVASKETLLGVGAVYCKGLVGLLAGAVVVGEYTKTAPHTPGAEALI